jgi:peptide/nickel transport system substrate-binding protein
MSITFTLRKGVRFHDGSDFNAEVAKWNLDNMINARMQPDWASVDIIDDYTVRVNFSKWTNTLPSSFSDASVVMAFMVSKAAFDKNGLDWMRRNPVGTGPFKFDSYKQDVSFKAVKNPDYWVKGKPYLDGITYIFIADPTTRKIAMETGEADMVVGVMAKDAADYAALGFTADFVVSATAALIPDSANADSPWANKKVREAVEYAINREGIAEAFGYGFWQAPYQIPPRYTLIYDPDFTLGRKYEPDKAKQLLAEAGYPDGFETTIIANPLVDRDVAVSVQADLAQIGIQVDLDFPESGKWITYMNPAGTWRNAALYMELPAGDVYNLGGLQFTITIAGKSWLRTPELMEAYHAAIVSPTPDIELVCAVTDMMTKDALMIPVYEGLTGMALRPDVMDTDIFLRCHPRLWNTEDAWLNK